MTLHPNTPKRIAAAAVAVAGVLLAFNVLNGTQLAAVAAAAAATAAIWQPVEKDEKSQAGNEAPPDSQ